MPKLATCAPRWIQSTPNVRAIVSIWPLPASAACMATTNMVHPGLLADEEQRVEHDRFRESDGQDRLHHHLGRRSRIAPDSGGCRRANPADADRRAERCQSDM